MDAKQSLHTADQTVKLTFDPAGKGTPGIGETLLDAVYDIPANLQESGERTGKYPLDLLPDAGKEGGHTAPYALDGIPGTLKVPGEDCFHSGEDALDGVPYHGEKAGHGAPNRFDHRPCAGECGGQIRLHGGEYRLDPIPNSGKERLCLVPHTLDGRPGRGKRLLDVFPDADDRIAESLIGVPERDQRRHQSGHCRNDDADRICVLRCVQQPLRHGSALGGNLVGVPCTNKTGDHICHIPGDESGANADSHGEDRLAVVDQPLECPCDGSREGFPIDALRHFLQLSGQLLYDGDKVIQKRRACRRHELPPGFIQVALDIFPAVRFTGSLTHCAGQLLRVRHHFEQGLLLLDLGQFGEFLTEQFRCSGVSGGFRTG